MRQTFTFLIGIPGAGKSTLVKRALVGLPRETSREILPHVIFPTLGLAMLGHPRQRGGGTDALHRGILPDACAFLEANALPHVFGEGDRLAVASLWRHAADLGYEVRILLLDTAEPVAKQRRNERAARDHEQAQDPRWVRGRITKTAKLADDWHAVRVDDVDTFWMAVPFGQGGEAVG